MHVMRQILEDDDPNEDYHGCAMKIGVDKNKKLLEGSLIQKRV